MTKHQNPQHGYLNHSRKPYYFSIPEKQNPQIPSQTQHSSMADTASKTITPCNNHNTRNQRRGENNTKSL